MNGMWPQKCEEVFQRTKEHTDEMWDSMEDLLEGVSVEDGWPPTIRGETFGDPGYSAVFSKRQIFQVNNTAKTTRPIRRLELIWGEEDGGVTTIGDLTAPETVAPPNAAADSSMAAVSSSAAAAPSIRD
jgi:hypothetical protein